LPGYRNTLAALAAAAATALAAGCGSDDADDTPATVAEAKATLSKDCQEGKAEDKPLCDCIGDELEKAGNDAKEILALNKKVNEGGDKPPAAVTKAAEACASKAAS